ncbi:hypothetical protein GO755_32910 [Spirosoma sp. HMF4905]|uniref:Transglycosylase SLT domain-containing protein n=1 Tax=Spirosoma arboris TaxID=2682092 RepID=A0A7K1SMN8_9BACT|nr:hypothetical protein [Spirosoma arboris]MVM34876.1 hypothetical protein [Spirosoma arboris]
MKSFLVLLFAVFSLNIAYTKPVKPKTLLYSELVPADQRAAFVEAVVLSAERLHVHPDWLMVVMRFETAGTFRANIRNRYSGAVGLIQFIPNTAKQLGTSPTKLAAMTLVEQVAYVEKYFTPYAGRMTDVYDVYIVVFAPAFLGRSNSTILYSANSPTLLGRQRYNWNKVLDDNRDGVITMRDVKRQIKRFVP